jgi:hypothetical protein
MKFVCIPCERPMTLAATASPEAGAIALTYGCPDCGYEFAMVTNAHETQLVSSLGVKIEGSDAARTGSKCPFTGVARELQAQASPVISGVPWTPQAEARMAGVPEFVRPFVRSGIDRFARERGYSEVTEGVLDEARQTLGM